MQLAPGGNFGGKCGDDSILLVSTIGKCKDGSASPGKYEALDWTRLSHSGRYDMKRLEEAMMLLIANDGPLGQDGWTIRFKATGLTTVNATSVRSPCMSSRERSL